MCLDLVINLILEEKLSENEDSYNIDMTDEENECNMRRAANVSMLREICNFRNQCRN